MSAEDLLAAEYFKKLAGLGDTVRLDISLAFRASRNMDAVRTVTVWSPDYTPRKRSPWQVVISNLTIEGGDESVPALLRSFADLLETAERETAGGGS